jgi:hypothetical protein
VLLLAWGKLWSVSRDELIVRDYPHDDPWYVTSASSWYWFTDGDDALVRQPGYPLWVAIAGTTGLPLRIATELLFLGAAAAFVSALARAGLAPLLCMGLFGVVAFHPFSFHVNRFALADSFYAPALLFGITGMILLVARGLRAWSALLAGIGLAAAWHTRQENVLIAAYVLLLGACVCWVEAASGAPLRTALKRAVPVVVILLAFVFTSSLGVRSVNLARFGVFAEHELAGTGFRNAYRALLRIEPEIPLRSIPVPREVRWRAYEASVSFRRLQPYFEGPRGRYWASFMQVSDDPRLAGEISAGPFPWALLHAARTHGRGSSVRDTDEFFRAVAREIDLACDQGRLQCRAAPLGPLDPHVGNYASRLPGSVIRVAGAVVGEDAPPPRQPRRPVRPEYVRLADATTNRRASLVRDHLEIAGWVVHPDDPVERVSFRAPDGEVLATTERLRSRPDLERYFDTRGWDRSGPTPSAFELVVPLPKERVPAGDLVFGLQSGHAARVPLERLRELPLVHILRVPAPVGVVEYAIERFAAPTDLPTPQKLFQTQIYRAYGPGVLVLIVCALATLPLRLLRGPRASRVLDSIALLLLGIVAGRVALLALVDASAWSAQDVRFLLPVAYLIPCAAVIVTYGTVRRAWAALRLRRG